MNDLDLDKALEEAVKSFPPAFMLPHEEDYYRLGFMDAWNLCHKEPSMPRKMEVKND